MRNKLLTLALGGVFALGTAGLLAQDQGQAGLPAGHPKRAMQKDPDQQLAKLTQKLNLTTDQQNQIKPILIDRQQKMQELMQNQSLSRDDRRSQSRSVMSDSNRIESVLTDEQKPKFEAMKQKRKNKKSGAKGSGDTTSQPPSTQPQSPQQ